MEKVKLGGLDLAIAILYVFNAGIGVVLLSSIYHPDYLKIFSKLFGI